MKIEVAPVIGLGLELRGGSIPKQASANVMKNCGGGECEGTCTYEFYNIFFSFDCKNLCLSNIWITFVFIEFLVLRWLLGAYADDEDRWMDGTPNRMASLVSHLFVFEEGKKKENR